MIISQKMSNNNELEDNLNETHCFSFFKAPARAMVSFQKNLSRPEGKRSEFLCYENSR